MTDLEKIDNKISELQDKMDVVKAERRVCVAVVAADPLNTEDYHRIFELDSAINSIDFAIRTQQALRYELRCRRLNRRGF